MEWQTLYKVMTDKDIMALSKCSSKLSAPMQPFVLLCVAKINKLKEQVKEKEDEIERNYKCNNPECDNISSAEIKFEKCGNCGVRYCCKECQVTDWKKYNHKNSCKPK